MTKDEALKLALDALNTTESDCGSRAWEREQEAITAIKEALAQPEQEPVAWMNQNGVVRKVGYEWGPNNTLTSLYTKPPQRTWVGLTGEEIKKIIGSDRYSDLLKEVVQYVEAKLKEKNNG
jgi:hypothetical protein